MQEIKQDTQTDYREYEMLRTEILQYLEEYQNVRNMMYLVTAAILSLNGAFWDEAYIFLVPLVVILPSYIVLYDYWRCVTIDSTYLEIYYEQDKDAPYHWEGRYCEFSKNLQTINVDAHTATSVFSVWCPMLNALLSRNNYKPNHCWRSEISSML